MTWVKLDDQFPIHRKVGALSDQAFRLHVEALCWCARHLTDGVVSSSDLPQVTRIAKSERYAAELVARGCWHRPGHDCPICPQIDSGWVLHEYLGFQQSRTKVLQTREARSAAGKVGGTRSGQSRRAAANGTKPQSRRGGEAKPKQTRSKTEAEGVEPPAPFLLTKEGTGAPASRGGARPSAARPPSEPENPDWRTLPPVGAPRDPADANRAHRGAAAVRAQIRRPPKEAT